MSWYSALWTGPFVLILVSGLGHYRGSITLVYFMEEHWNESPSFSIPLCICDEVGCGTIGTKLGYKSSIFKDFVSEKTRGIVPDSSVMDDILSLSVSLSCRSHDIMVNMNFSNPFRGLVHAGKKDSGCSFRGDGKMNYSLNVPHASCGTIHVTPQDSFANTLTIRYHPALELEGDEIKTILCKYGTGSIQLG